MLASCLLLSLAVPWRSAAAQQTPNSATATLPGSERPPGLGLSPEAPPVPPAPGGRAPSFGAPVEPGEWVFQIGGNISAATTVGFGQRPPEAEAPGQFSGPLHVPARTVGRQPFFPTTGASLFTQYGNGVITATANFGVRATGKEFQGYVNPTNGPAFGTAYLTVTPQPFGSARLALRVGAFTENFGGPGLYGWGIFGPLIAVRGFGESAILNYDLSDQFLLTLEHGILGVPSVPEDFARGFYAGWTETGISSFVQHAHAGFSYRSQYVLRLHFARSNGVDEREFLVTDPRDGHMDAYVLETRVVGNPYGELGVSGAFWNFKDAASVHDGIWWAINWTKGAQDVLRDFVGPNSMGNGKLAAVSAQYDMSLGQILWYPQSFPGTAPDVRWALAGIRYWTIESGDPLFDGQRGWLLGSETTYQMLRWFGTTLRMYGESRQTAVGRARIFSVSPGIAFRYDWLSTDRIEVVYTQRFYNSAADTNPAQPLDNGVLSLIANFSF